MATPADETKQVDVRSVWPNEALDFTPWLAKNLDLLGDALGMKLELIQTEKMVGPFFLDIQAKEIDRDVTVAIENQLEWTDFSHLAQILTYSAGLDARIAIWVAPEFRYESAEVLNWLNKWASPDVEFYGVKVEVIKIGDSPPAPQFRPVVTPGCWSKEITQPSGAPDPLTQKFIEFFQPLTNRMLRTGFANGSTQYWDHSGRFFPSRFDKDIGYGVYFWSDNAWVSLHIRTWESVERNNWIFDELQKSQAQIECSIDAEWVWQRCSSYTFSVINVRKTASIDDPPEKLEETRAWMQEHLPKLKAVFDPRLEKILSELPAEDAG